MGRVLWLADVLRDAGLAVVENPGWKARGPEGLSPLYQLFHHTASSPRGGPHPSRNVVVNGRRDLAGPLCNVLVWRDGTCEVIASGIANHAGRGTPLSNRSSIGWECENDGVGEPWPERQLEAIARGMAAVCSYTKRPASTVYGHKETALPKGRKIDPTGIDMSAWRSRVDALLSQEDDDMTPEQADQLNRCEVRIVGLENKLEEIDREQVSQRDSIAALIRRLGEKLGVDPTTI